ncbi:MAG: DUF885 domain-containing protein [candidate division Zixibacteria bacterium]|nr:DUF885 domain-containing protein [candidate division Zixibacteria bacterium]
MKRFIAVMVILLVGLSAGVAGETKNEKKFRKLSQEILESLQSFWPVHATEMGIHRHDSRFADYSPGTVKEKAEQLKKYLQRLRSLETAQLPADMATDLRLLQSNCEIGYLKLTRLEYHKTNPNLYIDDAVNGLYFILKNEGIPLRARVRDVIGRMEALPAFLQQGERNLTGPPPIWLDYARRNVDNAVAFYRTAAERLTGMLPDREDDINAARDKALAAFDHFQKFLNSLPAGSPTGFAIGKEYYDYLLQHEFFFGFDADSLLRIGEAVLARTQEAYEAKEIEYEAAGYFRRKPVFIPSAVIKRDVLDYYAWETNQVKQYLADSGIVTVPGDIAECRVIETPEFMRGVTGSLAYQPAGPFDTAAVGYFYVGVVPDSLTDEQKERYFRSMHDRGFRGGVVHEVYPGHHLQLQIAARHPSDVRRWQMNNLLIEGWALYCEEMMYDRVLYEDNPGRYLRVLGGIRFRAARTIADVKLQTGQFTYDEAVAWMAETMDSDTNFIKTEVLRYTMDPGQAMSYLMGKLAILDLRDKMAAREGSRFDLRTFHDRLLAEGSIPLGLIEKKLLP